MTEQSQNICKKVPLELLLHRLQLGFDESFIKYRLYGVQYILCNLCTIHFTVLKWITIREGFLEVRKIFDQTVFQSGL